MSASRHYCSSADDSESSSKSFSPKISALVDEIASLSLLEASELTEALKERLGEPPTVL